MNWRTFLHLYRPATGTAVPICDRTVSRFDSNQCLRAHRRNLFITPATHATAIRGHTGGGGGYCSDLFKADKCFTKSFYLDNGFIIIFPVGADCQSQRRIQGQQTHFVSKLSAGFGVICRAQTSLNLTRGRNISQARKRQLKAPYYYFPLFPPANRTKSLAEPIQLSCKTS